MAENISTKHETGSAERLTSAERLLPTPEQAEPLRKGEVDPQLQASHARHEIAEIGKSTADPLERLQTAEQADTPAPSLNINQELKSITLNRELRSIQRKLPAPARTFSKLVHQPVVRVLSELSDRTVSRPSGLLGGSLVAFMGTSAYLYLAKSHGYRYNYLIFLLLFAGGFIVGLILELLVHVATSSRRHAND